MRGRGFIGRLLAPVQRRSLLVLLLILMCSGLLGLGTVRAIAGSSPATISTVDPVASEYALGQELYLENCATCHIGIPPAVFPGETWRQLLRTTAHYGVVIPPLVDPSQSLIWNYLRDYSRGLNADETVPYRLGDSRYFKALHPQVEVPRPVQLTGCVSCHPGAEGYDFRRLSPEWE
jgi:hypothetical protein